jgi:nitrilase
MNQKIAVIQNPPVLLNLEATLDRAVKSIKEVARAGAKLAVFPEAFLPGYPTWIWRLKPGADMALSGEIHDRLRNNAVDIESGALTPIMKAAREHGITVVCGMNEVDGRYSGSTLFNSVVTIGPDGQLLNHRRKLMPTNPERMVWGMGDASGLHVVDTPVGRIGCLICWEIYMPLARYALYAQNLEVLVAPTWDCGEGWQASLRHIAREGGCWVVSLATALHSRDIPKDFPQRDRLFDTEEWICDGGAVVVEPFGGPVAGPLHQKQEVLYAEIDPARAAHARRSFDVAGHYARPDIFSLTVNRSPMPPAVFTG